MKTARFTHITAFIVLGIALLAVSGCDDLKVKDSLEGVQFELTDQHHNRISFPDQYAGSVMLVGYVYTFCPDICPLITYNMRDIQEELEGEENFKLVSITFDPMRDDPETLYDYANNYRLDQSNWSLLTGDQRNIEKVLDRLQIRTLKSPTRFSDDGRPLYFIDHSDKVTLIDKKGNVRRTYLGSELSKEQVANDIRTLLRES